MVAGFAHRVVVIGVVVIAVLMVVLTREDCELQGLMPTTWE
jgi:hypothetical protein